MLRIKLVSFLFLMGFIVVPNALAVNSQGLVWGVEVDQEIQYTLRIIVDFAVPTNPIDLVVEDRDETYDIIYTVKDIPVIPDSVDHYTEIPSVQGEMTFENGSSISSILESPPSPLFVKPIGNWELINGMYRVMVATAPSNYNFTWTDDPLTWGYTCTINYSYFIKTITTLYSKADGLVSTHSSIEDYSPLYTSELTFTRVQELGNDTTTLLIIGVGLAAIVIVGLVAWKAR